MKKIMEKNPLKTILIPEDNAEASTEDDTDIEEEYDELINQAYNKEEVAVVVKTLLNKEEKRTS